jgi:hypothetical protein
MLECGDVGMLDDGTLVGVRWRRGNDFWAYDGRVEKVWKGQL